MGEADRLRQRHLCRPGRAGSPLRAGEHHVKRDDPERGIRFDYWVPGRYVDDIASDTSSALIVPLALRRQYLEHTFPFGYRAKGRISPRLGISHPVSDNQTLFFPMVIFRSFPTTVRLFEAEQDISPVKPPGRQSRSQSRDDRRL
ncbi:MAG: hypothetical protein MZV64_29795 [Ignavibacteriales bacterium]|nr:hypothetical protein [Ignavibacteriales bacterium]